jgi:hypothetical protein
LPTTNSGNCLRLVDPYRYCISRDWLIRTDTASAVIGWSVQILHQPRLVDPYRYCISRDWLIRTDTASAAIGWSVQILHQPQNSRGLMATRYQGPKIQFQSLPHLSGLWNNYVRATSSKMTSLRITPSPQILHLGSNNYLLSKALP